jgi:hypothetical protein
MSLFVVTVRGENVRATFDGAETLCGFFKNEFVRASTPQEADAKARANVLAALRLKKTVNQQDLSSLSLSIDSIRPSRWGIGMLRPQGFVFHRMEKAADCH